jgi:hypothetical protein
MVENISASYTSTVQSSEDKRLLFNDLRKNLSEKQSKTLLHKDTDKKTNPFLSEDAIPTDRPEPFLTNDFVSAERPQPFLTQETDTSNAQSPLELPKNEESDAEEAAIPTIAFPKNNDTILAELRRNALHSMMTARDIAEEYNISYQKAMDIFKALNEDSNGVVKEFKLPENATVSYLV